MKPAKRIKVIKLVATKLSDLDDWAEIDLTLRTFGFPWSQTWDGGGKYDYLLYHLEKGSDKNLLSIHEYITGQRDAEELDIKEIIGPWKTQKFRLFISHITKDKLFISEVKSELSKFGIDGFVAHEDITPTTEWVDEILNALDTCDALAAFITPLYHSSLWTDQEAGYAMRRRILVVPVGIGKTPYGFMGRYQGIQGKDKPPEKIAEEIFEALIKNSKTKAKMAEALVSNFESSSSFDTAAKRARLLYRIENWTPELLRRLQEAAERNSQISGSFAAMPVVKRLLEENKF